MSSEADGNRWDPYCPCKATSKNMVIIGSGKNFLEFLNEQIHLKLIFYIPTLYFRYFWFCTCGNCIMFSPRSYFSGDETR